MIAIVDYGMGNLASVRKALEYIRQDCRITDDPGFIEASDALILPGVGAFSPAMELLRQKGLDEAVTSFAGSGRPVLGICLGMQLMLTDSEEGAGDGEVVKGLNLVPGHVLKFPSQETVEKGLKVPQIGWNRLTDVKGSLLREGDFVYFVHSYYCAPDNPEDAAAFTDYGIRYACAIERGNILATQFHPEKSGEAGLLILERFAGRIKR